MNKPFDQSKDEVARLCRYFANNRQAFLAAGVKEAHIRQSLIDPFFEALGWDMRNAAMAAPQYREVITEDSLDIEGQQKAPDYTFRVGTLAKFYVEAKKCGVNINVDMGPAYQLRRYGFSAKLALSILTDFEELSVYDCASRPRPNDKASHARIQYFGFAEYPDRWQEIWDVFSREAVWSGTFDQYAVSKRKRGTSEVDSEFLKDIEGWRDVLARNLALRNGDLSADDLNAVVQRIIDRIIFLRMAEDRGLESYGQLHKLCEQPDIYDRFMSGLCRKADQKYNSGLFHFQKEPGVADAPDTLTPRLAVDDNALKPILQSLYFEHGCPYHFGVLPVEILGTVYERFLGKVIRLTAGHQAKVEEKPEVRKAGGVYYTPAYIVNYIVLNTIGKQIAGKSPVDLAGNKTKPPFRVLDMACGSGSFLLGAYQFLLDHCLKWYQVNHSKKHANAVYQNAKGETRLTIAERKRILTTHIFGVDIDRQAVETTKLSLLLKALEGENDSSLSQQMSLFHERALPNLSDNIKCGNSLIASDFSMLPEDLIRVHAFDWPAQFPDAMKAGGFDAIIGNPPYIRIQTMQESSPESVNYLSEHYAAAAKGNYDIYVVFVEHALSLLNSTGRLGYILPHKFFNAHYGEALRGLIAEGKHLSSVVHFGDQQVFDGATTYTCLLFLDKSSIKECSFVKVNDLIAWHASGEANESFIKSKYITALEWNFSSGNNEMFEKLAQMSVTLGEISHLFVGLQTDADDVFIVEEISTKGNQVLCWSKALEKEYWFENEHLKQFLKGSLNIRRYCLSDVTKRLIFPYETRDEKSVLIDPKDYKRRYPLSWAYLVANQARLAERNKGKMGHEWHGYVYKKNHTRFCTPKIVVPSLAKGSCFAADFEGRYYFVGSGGGGGGGYGIVPNEGVQFSILYLLGLLNSKLLSAIIRANSTSFRGGYLALNRQYIEHLPIRTIDFSKPTDKTRHNKLVGLVEKMLALMPKLGKATSESEKAALQNAVTTIDAEIDRLVYELYGLTKEEIKIVEQEL